MLIAIRPQRLFNWLLACIAALVCLHVLSLWAFVTFPGHSSEKLREIFDLSGERDIPSLYSTLQLGFAAVILLVLHREARRNELRGSGAWLALAGLFGFLAMDEYIMIHERLSKPVTSLLGSGSVPLFAWVLPYAVLVAIGAAFFFRFWWQLPRDIRWQMAVAATIYVGGALGMELLGSKIFESVGPASMLYTIEEIVEESMEMIGIALFIRTLAQLVQSRVGTLTFQFDTLAVESHAQLMKDLETADRRKADRRAG